MMYRNLGATGLKLAGLGLGTMQWNWRASEEDSFAIMDAFLDMGGNLLDTANIYSRWVPHLEAGSSETVIGKWLASRGRRDQVVLATKVRGPMSNSVMDQGLSRRHIMQALEDSLRRLQTDYVDLYQMHWYDAETPIEETLYALDALVRQGKVRYIGCSNYPAWRLMEALWTSERNDCHRFVSLQPHYSLVHRREFEAELADVCTTYGVGVIPYSPMGGGFLTGAYSRSETPDSPRASGVKAKHFNEKSWAVLEAVEAVAARHESWPGAIALAWLLTRPAVVAPIVGANSIDQLKSNFLALEIQLTAEDIRQLETASSGL